MNKYDISTTAGFASSVGLWLDGDTVIAVMGVACTDYYLWLHVYLGVMTSFS